MYLHLVILCYNVWVHHCFLPCIQTTVKLKFSDDTVLLSLLGIEEDSSMHQCCTKRLVEWCERNSLVINENKTKENIFCLPEFMHQTQVTIHNTLIEKVSSYKYLGVYASSWGVHIDYVCCKEQQRIYFLRRLRYFGASKQILLLFFQSVIQSVVQYGIYALYTCLSFNSKLDWLDRYLFVLRLWAKCLSQVLMSCTHTKRTLSLTGKIMLDPSHILYEEYQLLPSNRSTIC